MGFYLEILGVLAAIVAFGTGYFLTGEVPEEAAPCASNMNFLRR